MIITLFILIIFLFILIVFIGRALFVKIILLEALIHEMRSTPVVSQPVEYVKPSAVPMSFADRVASLDDRARQARNNSMEGGNNVQ